VAWARAIIGQRQTAPQRHRTSCLGWRSSASSTRLMIPMRSIPINYCGALLPSMDAIP